MKKLSKILALLLAVMLIAAMALPVSAFADYSVTGTSTTFVKNLVMDADANVPNATFSFTVAPGTAVAASEGKAAVLAGIGTPTIADVTFAVGNSTTDGLPSDAAGSTTEGKKYASKTATIDFSTITFTEPGIYRYVVTETATTNLGVTNDATATRTLDVYVIDTDGVLSVASYVLYSGTYEPATGTGTATEPTGKNDSYDNEYDTSNLTFSKTVTGNQGSRDKYFKFTVEITGAVAGTVYTVDLSNADGTVGSNAATKSDYVGKTNPASLTVGADGTVTGEFYLHHGQSITIKGLAKGTSYTITEENEDYTVTKSNDSGTIASEDITAAFTNNRSGLVPTGVMLTIAPFAAILLIGAVGIVVMLTKKKKAE